MTVSEKLQAESQELASRSIHTVQWSPRVTRALEAANIRTFGDLHRRIGGADFFKAMDLAARYEIETMLSNIRLYFSTEPEPNTTTTPVTKGKMPEGIRHHVSSEPSHFAEYLLYLLLPQKYRECLPGDLAEEYWTLVLPKFGIRKAKLWYWKQVITSLWPVFWPQVKRVAALAGAAKLAEEVRKWIKS